jgi:hypothetical protein
MLFAGKVLNWEALKQSHRYFDVSLLKGFFAKMG